MLGGRRRNTGGKPNSPPSWPRHVPGFTIKNPSADLGNMRAVKSPREIDLLKHAVDITAEGFQRAYALPLPARRSTKFRRNSNSPFCGATRIGAIRALWRRA
jgi:hypothetical protein